MKNKFYTEIGEDFTKAFLKKIKSAKSIVITSHKSPDDDSISSILSMYYYLTEYQKIPQEKVKMVYTGDKLEKWSYFKNYDKIQFVEELTDHLEDVDLLIMLDGSGWGRFSWDEGYKFKGSTVCIDHHPNPQEMFNLHIVVTPFSSTAEIVYRLFFANEKLDKNIAEVLLLGILGDTGNFRFSTPETSGALGVSQRLIEEGGIKVEAMQAKYQKMEFGVLSALSVLMINSRVVTIEGWPPCLVSFFPKKMMSSDKYQLKEIDEASGLFAPFLKDVKDVPWGIVAIPVAQGVSAVSLRSLPNSVSCRAVMMEMGIGGGHDRAAAGKIKTEDSEEAINTILEWLRKNKPVIN